jgi:hypothetical protein
MIKCASQNIITLELFYAEWLLTKSKRDYIDYMSHEVFTSVKGFFRK